ncbi:MAG: iron-sulfur cluster repair di-iron protein [Bacteroidetes bacterium]|nr:iron-sulfur cluster repair di-iron protein [Bacteroidota bacterium]
METIRDLPLSELAIRRYQAIATLEKYGLDYCCHGDRSLEESCREKNLNIADVEDEIRRSHQTENPNPSSGFENMELNLLVDHILQVHHAFLRRQIPVISEHLSKVSTKHGDNHHEVKEITYCFAKLRSEIEYHMRKEEEILFPYICFLAEAASKGESINPPPFQSIRNPIRMMESEHEVAGDILKEIRKWSNNFQVPGDACTTFQVTYKELEEVEKDLHMHIHLENNILFPRSIELEKELLK